MSLNKKYKADFEAVVNLLRSYFGPDQNKIRKWLASPSQEFGGVAPLTIISSGRAGKLMTFLRRELYRRGS